MEPIYVTKTFLPPLNEFIEKLEQIWDSHFVTNDGPMFQEFEAALRNYTGVNHLVAVGNGTLALQLAIRALDLKDEVITTPFTHVASSGSLVWENCKPVYADIDPETLNIDPGQIEKKITERTTGIMAVHVYSNPCYMNDIEYIAKKHNLRVIYDGAHAFGAEYQGKSVFAYGDITMASFNATKGMHTIEGGALFVRDETMVECVRKLAYFGMDARRTITQTLGMNAKLIEFCAAIGVINLKYFDSATARRKERYEQYLSLLRNNPHMRFQKLIDKINYSYMPVVVESKAYKENLTKKLNENKIYPRDYFYPSLETVFSDRIDCPISFDISNRVLCLPMSDYLSAEDVERICKAINEV